MKNEGFNASNDSFNKGLDLAGSGEEDKFKKKRKKSRSWSVVVKQASLQMTELNYRHRTVLSDVHEAVREGTLDVVDQAIARAKKNRNLNDLDDMGLSGLHHAVRYNRYEAVAKLLDHGAQVNIGSRDESNTPLHISSRFGWRETTKLLLDHGANANAKNNNGSTPLHLACRRGNKELVALLLDAYSIEVNATDKSLLTPLHVAAIHGEVELCKMLLDKGADYMAPAIDKMTPLHIAVANGNRKASKVILDQAIAMSANMSDIISARDIDSNTILHLAALTNDKEIAEEILKYQPSVNLTKTNFATPLHLACTKGHLEMVKLFVSKGADIHYSRTFDGRTALHKAASFGHLDIINFLLDEGAKIDARDYVNRTPFLEAVASGQSGSAVLLLSRGAKITVYDNLVKNCLHLAIENENLDTLMVLLDTDGCLENLYSPDVRERVPLHYAAVSSNIKVLQGLLKKQTRLAFQDENQQTPLYLAAEAGRADHVEALGRSGSSINDRDDEGRSALHVAAAKGHRKVCEKLIKLGADVNYRDSLRSTPLMAAARNGGIKTCEALLENEAKIDDVNSSGDTALLEAVRYNHEAVVELLLDCGASVAIRNDSNLGLIDTAVKYGSSRVAMAICQHQRWKEVLNDKTDPHAQPPMKLLIAHFPDAAKLIMDKCVQPAEHMSPSDHDYTITYDFQYLDPGPDHPASLRGKRYFGPKTMVQNNQEHLLLHPLTQVLLDKKWYSLGQKVYALNFLTFLAFTVLYTLFLVDERNVASFRPLAATNTSQASSLFRKTYLSGSFIPFVILGFAVLQMAKEVLQIFFQRKIYFTQASNALEWILYGTTVVFMIPYVAPDSWVDTHYGQFNDPFIMWVIAVVSIFFCYVNFVLFLRRFATLGLFISMHVEVIRTVAKVMIVFIVFVFAFSVVFFILFKEQAAFQTLGHAFLKVIIMMVGEIEYDDTFIATIGTSNSVTKNPENPFPEAAFVFIFLFVFIMGISLMNLLVGLAVGDIDKIQREATLKRQAMQVEFVSQVEDKYPRFISRMIYKQVFVLKPNQPSLMTRIKRRFLGTEDSPANYTSYTEPYDSTKELNKKIDKTKKRVKYLIDTMESQNRLLKALARKIDPLMNVESFYEDDLITTEAMPENDDDQQEFNFASLDGPKEEKEADSKGVDVAL